MNGRVLLLVVLITAPIVVGQESLTDRLREISFRTVVITTGPDSIVVDGASSMINQDRARELRRCIDGEGCPDPIIASLGGQGNRDGRVTLDEVRAFEARLVFALNSVGDQVQLVRERIQSLVQIDGRTAGSIKVNKITFRDADGSVDSMASIRMDVVATASFNTDDKGKHAVRMARTETSLEIADEFVIRAPEGWSIVKSSIRPEGLQNLHQGGEIRGRQAELEGNEPLTYTIDKDTNWPLWIALSLLLAAIAAGLVYWYRRRRRAPAKA